MITPSFNILQDEKYLIFLIRAPYANIADVEIEYVDDVFVFSAPPYYLRVHLPGEVGDDNSGTVKYDSTPGEFTVHVPKKNEGEHFPRLDMITELLNPQKKLTAQQLVEELEHEGDEVGDESDSQYFVEQQITDVGAEVCDDIEDGYGYGFAWRRKGILGQLCKEIEGLVELPDPEHSLISERCFLCAEHDVKSFDFDRYLYDLVDPEEGLLESVALELTLDLDVDLDDRRRLKDLPRKVLPILSIEEHYLVSLSLVDIVFAFVYDLRTNGWETSCECGWNIVKLAPSLAFLCQWKNAKEAVTACVRRSLIYPLYRSWDLSMKVISDVKAIIQKGRSALLHILSKIHGVLIDSGEFRYLFNDLFITDYCIWIQYVHESTLITLQEELTVLEICKADVGLDLDLLELQGYLGTLDVDEKLFLDSDDEPE